MLTQDQLVNQSYGAKASTAANTVRKSGSPDQDILRIMRQIMAKNNMTFVDKGAVVQEVRGKMTP